MRVTAFDHVNIHTQDVPGTVRFYAELLGLEPRNTPAPFPPDQAQWLLDDEGRAIIHLFRGAYTPGSTGPIHHIALRCSGKVELLERLTKRGAKFDVHKASGELTQVFTRDPHGILLELSFFGE